MRKNLELAKLAIDLDGVLWEQGFVDNKQNFVHRQEAFKIAVDAGQVINSPKHTNTQELFSEDIC
jgi:hypothetical protein